MTDQEKRVALAIFPSADYPSHHHLEAARRAIATMAEPDDDDAARVAIERAFRKHEQLA